MKFAAIIIIQKPAKRLRVVRGNKFVSRYLETVGKIVTQNKNKTYILTGSEIIPDYHHYNVIIREFILVFTLKQVKVVLGKFS